MGKLMLKETVRVTETVTHKRLEFNGKVIDLTEMLNRDDKLSKEYRAKDIEAINIDAVEKKSDSMCKFKVVAADSFDCAKYSDDKIGVLNFASTKHPGGGFEVGALAQEECLCYRSNLYFDLKEHEDFYNYNRNDTKKCLYTDGIIYSENIVVFRDAKYNNCEPVLQNVITCAAPNWSGARRLKVTEAERDATMYRRIEQVLKVAIDNNIKHLVLGAFGCGVFKNDPKFVATAMKELLVDKEYGKYFNLVTFAMHDSVSENTKEFNKVFGRL